MNWSTVVEGVNLTLMGVANYWLLPRNLSVPGGVTLTLMGDGQTLAAPAQTPDSVYVLLRLWPSLPCFWLCHPYHPATLSLWPSVPFSATLTIILLL